MRPVCADVALLHKKDPASAGFFMKKRLRAAHGASDDSSLGY